MVMKGSEVEAACYLSVLYKLRGKGAGVRHSVGGHTLPCIDMMT